VNDILKQRLVGALILVALGVVFWPIIFVQPGDKEVAQQQQIPPRPGVAITPIEPPDQMGLRASPEHTAMDDSADEGEVALPADDSVAATSLEPAPGPVPIQKRKVADTGDASRSKPPAPLVMDGDGVPVAWILQVASVSSAEKADELRRRLLSMNYKAYVKKVQRGGAALHRVYLGPKFERAKLEQMQSAIDAEFGVKSIVARYIP
jgi:DedD protein